MPEVKQHGVGELSSLSAVDTFLRDGKAENPTETDLVQVQEEANKTFINITHKSGFYERHSAVMGASKEYDGNPSKQTAGTLLKATTDFLRRGNPADELVWHLRRKAIASLVKINRFDIAVDESDPSNLIDNSHLPIPVANNAREMEILSSDLGTTMGLGTGRNFQMWSHRRWLFQQLSEICTNSKSKADINFLQTWTKYELEAISKLLEDDPRCYNAWCHRQHMLRHYYLNSEVFNYETATNADPRKQLHTVYQNWATEVKWTTERIVDDVENHSAWQNKSLLFYWILAWELGQRNGEPGYGDFLSRFRAELDSIIDHHERGNYPYSTVAHSVCLHRILAEVERHMKALSSEANVEEGLSNRLIQDPTSILQYSPSKTVRILSMEIPKAIVAKRPFKGSDLEMDTIRSLKKEIEDKIGSTNKFYLKFS